MYNVNINKKLTGTALYRLPPRVIPLGPAERLVRTRCQVSRHNNRPIISIYTCSAKPLNQDFLTIFWRAARSLGLRSIISISSLVTSIVMSSLVWNPAFITLPRPISERGCDCVLFHSSSFSPSAVSTINRT